MKGTDRAPTTWAGEKKKKKLAAPLLGMHRPTCRHGIDTCFFRLVYRASLILPLQVGFWATYRHPKVYKRTGAHLRHDTVGVAVVGLTNIVCERLSSNSVETFG